MARLHASVLVIDFSATARLVLSRRTGLSTGPNKIFCPAGIGSSACPHMIGTSRCVVGRKQPGGDGARDGATMACASARTGP